jgi:hypothetical protein
MFFSTSSRTRRWRAASAAVAAAALIAVSSGLAFASSVDVAVVDATIPTGSVSLAPGGSAPITIDLTVTGKQDGTATFQVNRNWALNGGTFTGSNPQTFTVNPQSSGTTTTFSTTGTVSANAGQAAGTFTLAAGAFNLTNSNQTGAKLNLGNAASYAVTVAQTNTTPHVSVGGVTDGTSYEFGSVPAASCTATDAEDASPSANPQLSAITGPLATYGLGSRTVTCSYTDGGGLSDTATATYSIVDTTKPTLNTPGSQSLEATGPSGATATWSDPTGSDNVALAAGSPSCDVASPQTFDLGVHTVNCSATDVAGNTKTGSFTITVTDTTGPSVTAPNDVTEEAADSSGAIVAYSGATASDVHDGSLTPICTPASASVFAVGDTTVTCTATDSSGNTGSATFQVHVVDTTPPDLDVPGDIVVEATSPSGAPATFTVTATDTVDGATSVTCDHDSGDAFAFGATTVSCSSTDAHSNTGHGSFKVTVVDTTPPVLDVHGDKTVEATGPTGATVTYTKPGASDIASTTVAVDCLPASGSTFALGSTQVDCTATDEHGNDALSHFAVIVQDTTPPDLTVPADKTVEATGPSGAAVTFSATASDLVDGSTTVDCTPASGSTFALGDTTVDCSSTDAHHNTGHASFKVSVADTTAPTLHLPSNITTSASSAAGAVVSYTATADDLVDASVTPTCVLSSGSTFGPGTTTVNCSATDDSGNTATGSFTVTVNFGWNGFFAPVDNNGVLNAIKGGQSVPLKWNIPNGSGGWISSLEVVSSIRQATFTCTAGAPTDDVEAPTSGQTSLRYDTTANQYIYNWQSPKTSNTCYKVTVNLTDGSSRSALFKTK